MYAAAVNPLAPTQFLPHVPPQAGRLNGHTYESVSAPATPDRATWYAVRHADKALTRTTVIITVMVIEHLAALVAYLLL